MSEQNLLPDTSGTPIRHPEVAEVFEQDDKRRLPAAQQPDALSGTRCANKRRGSRPRLSLLAMQTLTSSARARRRRGAAAWLLLALELLARLFGFLLQLFLQFALLLLEQPSDRSAGHHRPWRNRSSGSGRLIAVPCMLMACTMRFWPFFILAIMSSVTG